jgi:hypothetical protein
MTMAKQFVQAYKQTPRRKQIQRLGLYVLPVITLGTIFALYLIFSAQAATAGLEIHAYLDAKEELQRTIANENTQLAWLLSNTNMIKRAEELGFSQISSSNIFYMVLPSYPGRTVHLTSPAPDGNSEGDIVLNSAYQQSLGDFLRDLLFSNSNDEAEP